MRLAPVPIRCARMFPERLDRLIHFCVESSLPTHASPQCLSACAYLGLILCGLIHGIPRVTVLSPDWEELHRLQQTYPLHPLISEVAEGSFRRKQPSAIVGSGHVVKSLEAALWAFYDADDFREAVLQAVNLGDDADTTGAVCGQLAGAYWGESGIPVEWRDGLACPDTIENALESLMGPGHQSHASSVLSRSLTGDIASIGSGSWAMPAPVQLLTEPFLVTTPIASGTIP